ncbi:MAG: hypothetical protein L0Z50_16730 [Verrucomicrobiales bacterium]|nr:hypothetical protein [Verrucomicrobiales bacterium]
MAALAEGERPGTLGKPAGYINRRLPQLLCGRNSRAINSFYYHAITTSAGTGSARCGGEAK